jgi:acyl-CoA thioester hydrolase
MQIHPTSLDTSDPGFRWTVRVYYEDTDTAGVVYYANYLKFFERCRTEWLRALGIEQQRLAAEHRLQFVVRALQCDYHRAARLDDLLHIDASIARLGGASLEFAQIARRGGELLAASRTKVACVATDGRGPQPLPALLLQALKRTRSGRPQDD